MNRQKKVELSLNTQETKEEDDPMVGKIVKIISQKSKFCLLSIILIAFCACNRDVVYEDYCTISNNSWAKDSSIYFKPYIKDRSKPLDLFINVRHNNGYPNSNLWLFMEISYPDGAIKRDTVEFTLANRAGKWYGQGSGHIYNGEYLYKKNVLLPDTGTYYFKIKHGMRINTLPNIEDIGLTIKSDN